MAWGMGGRLQNVLHVLPVVALCYAVGGANFAVRDAVVPTDSALLVGTAATWAWFEAYVCLTKAPVLGVAYLRRKPLMLLVEGGAWAVGGWVLW